MVLLPSLLRATEQLACMWLSVEFYTSVVLRVELAEKTCEEVPSLHLLAL